MLSFKECFVANKKQIIKNHKEWLKLIKSKKAEDVEILETYRKEFSPFKAEDSEEYATITIDRMAKNMNIPLSNSLKEKYVNELLTSFKKII